MEDWIDRHVELWSRELPDLDPLAEQIIVRMQVFVRAMSRTKQAALTRHGLDVWQYQTLLDLRRRGAPYHATPSELASSLQLSPAAMTKRLDALERAGFVRRTPDPGDRRRIVVTLTDQGLAAWEQTVGEQSTVEIDALGHLSLAQRKQLAALLRRLVLAADELDTPGSGGSGRDSDA
ncbi:MarR family winged helix-turn-helix transcriptional regulator [Actinopolymorpha alba]|uniref:MarR family winged helix-turn-helix transcriptional regulator n=1 Tax=Actinopolymorpha alba TaxID=533267 RepID=UPI0003A195FC|nr:MarR family transcriptional regulator [Actinopolymorpha alba]